ncbi:hypothetical protein MPER_10644, partial [Moniliophthora perniciosa FA553]
WKDFGFLPTMILPIGQDSWLLRSIPAYSYASYQPYRVYDDIHHKMSLCGWRVRKEPRWRSRTFDFGTRTSPQPCRYQ